MALESPDLDNRRFQDLVDEAKRRIPSLTPEWTDHNLSDPGVAIIELFAWMTEQTLFRLNQVPERMLVQFLDLMGLRLDPPQAAEAEQVFTLAAPPVREQVVIPAGTRVSTPRALDADPTVFLTTENRSIPVSELVAVVSTTADDSPASRSDRTVDLATGNSFSMFADLEPGSATYFGFDGQLSHAFLQFQLDAVGGVGASLTDTPWSWEALTNKGWMACRFLDDGTTTLSHEGAVEMAVPSGHSSRALAVGIGDDRVSSKLYWLRCRLLNPKPGQETWTREPLLQGATATVLGVVSTVRHGTPVAGTLLGYSNGEPGQSFALPTSPILERLEGEHIEVAVDGTVETWDEVLDFSQSAPDDPHVVWDPGSGAVHFGPSVRAPRRGSNERFQQFGAIPPHGAEVRVSAYHEGGGSTGNLGAGSLRVMRSTIAHVQSTRNLSAATGGVDAETLELALERAPMWLQARERAVTANDFKTLAEAASPSVVRAHARWSESDGAVVVSVLPHHVSEVDPSSLTRVEIVPAIELVGKVQSILDERRVLTTPVSVGAVETVSIRVIVPLVGAPGIDLDDLSDRASLAIYRWLHPTLGGDAGDGWPFGVDIHAQDVQIMLRSVEGVVLVGSVKLRREDDPERQDRDLIELASHQLPLAVRPEVSARGPQ